MGPSLQIYLLAVSGSAFLEIVRAVWALETGNIPPYYRKPSYWIVRLLLALGSGVLALAYDVTNKILAFQIGATAPAIMQTLVQSPPDLGPRAGPLPPTPPAPAGTNPTNAAPPLPAPTPSTPRRKKGKPPPG